MSNYSRILTAIPIILGLLMIAANVQFGYEIDESAINLIEFIVGGTIIGGVSRSGFKKYLKYKEKLNGIEDIPDSP